MTDKYQLIDSYLIENTENFKKLYPELDLILENNKGDERRAEKEVLDLFIEKAFPDIAVDQQLSEALKSKILPDIDEAARQQNITRLAKLTDMTMSLSDDKRRLG